MTFTELESLVADAKARGAKPNSLIRVTIKQGNSSGGSYLVTGRIGRSIMGGPELEVVADNNDYD